MDRERPRIRDQRIRREELAKRGKSGRQSTDDQRQYLPCGR